MSNSSEKSVNESIISAIITREGGFVNDAADRGGPTIHGISKNANPDAWKNGPPTEEEAREIYMQRYVKGPGFDKITDHRLRHLLVDFSTTSGPSPAIQCLQRTLGLTVDGILGPKNLAAANGHNPVVLTNKLVAERIRLIAKIVSNNPSQSRFVLGWINRCLEFWIY